MKTIINWWGDNHVAANLLMIGIIFAGFIGFGKMEREMFPTIPFPGMQIVVGWPGASPADVEEQIVNRIEESLKDLENLDWIRSESGEGYGGVYILADTDTDFARIMDEVTSRVESITNFPPDIEQPRIQQWQTRNESIRVAVHGDVSERVLSDLARQMRREVASLNGISIVELFGIRNEEIAIEVSESALRRYGVSFDEISRAIRGSSLNLSAGNLRTDAGEYTLRTRNLAYQQSDFENIVIRQLPQGGSVKVSDVAKVIDGFDENEILATLNGEPAVLVQVMSSEYMDVVLMSNSVNKWVEERRKSLPEGVSLTVWTDNAVDFKSRMSTIGSAAFSGLILVFIVLFLTLRPIIAFWVAIGIGTAFAGAFVFLPAVGVSLNMLSTFAFLLVLGIVVDDAIIVGESVHSEFEKGNLGLSGATKGAFSVSKPVIFGVITTIIAFLPWIFLSGTTQEFTRQISWVVMLALGFSLIEALFILPAHLSNVKERKPGGRIMQLQHKISESIVSFGHNTYGPWLRKSSAVPGITFTLFIAIFIVVMFGIMGNGYVKSAFEPEIESEQVSVNIDLRDGTTYERALEILADVQLAQESLVNEVAESAENDNHKFVDNWYTRSRKDSVIAILRMAPAEVRSISAKDAALRLRELIGDVAEAKQVNVSYTDGGGNNPDLDISVRHPDLDVLRMAVAELRDRVRKFSSLTDVTDSLESASEELRFELKPGAEKLGLTLGAVMLQVRQAYYGEEVQRLPRNGQDVRVMVRYPLESRKSLESLKNFRIRMNDGREVPLTSVVDVSYGPGLKQIDHWDGLRSARVTGYLTEPVLKDIMKELEDNFYPAWEAKYPGLTRANIGASSAEQEFMAELMVLMFLALFGMYCMLAIAFKSYSQPAIILVAIPFAVVGAVLGHLINGMAFSIYSYFGVIAASGVVINDNLVLIDAYNTRRRDGESVSEAIQTAAKSRFRPILITSVTTFIGLVPMMLEESSQAAWLQPVVISLSYGLLVAFFVTLFLVPALLILGDRFTAWRSRLVAKVLGRDQPTSSVEGLSAKS